MEALSVLGRLNPSLEGLAQRVSTEVHTMIQSTLDEVDER